MSAKEKLKTVLVYSTPEGSREAVLENGETRIGRGEVELRFADASLSRHHATIFREGECLWVLDENSTNGTFVNGAEVAPNGTILNNGDSIRVGNELTFKLKIERVNKQAAQQQNHFNSNTLASQTQSNAASQSFIPLIIVCVAVFIIGTVIVIAAARFAVSGEDNREVVQSNQEEQIDEPLNANQNDSKPAASPTPVANNSNSSNGNLAEPPTTTPQKPPPVAPTKTYLAMSDAEKRQFIEVKAKAISAMIGNGNPDDTVPSEAVERIKVHVDGYASRLKRDKLPGVCNFTRDNLETLIERASRNAGFIVPAFNSEGIAPQVGIYLAMIESEHCVCLQSNTGPLGMFQFTYDTGSRFGLKVIRGATQGNLEDERCQPEKAAPAAARYMKFLMGRYGTSASSVPLAIASYNSGEGGLSRNLETALKAAQDKDRNFWTLLLMVDKLSAQFQRENKKYVPLFFATAIIGENPPVFGINKPPISSNTQ